MYVHQSHSLNRNLSKMSLSSAFLPIYKELSFIKDIFFSIEVCNSSVLSQFSFDEDR